MYDILCFQLFFPIFGQAVSVDFSAGAQGNNSPSPSPLAQPSRVVTSPGNTQSVQLSSNKNLGLSWNFFSGVAPGAGQGASAGTTQLVVLNLTQPSTAW